MGCSGIFNDNLGFNVPNRNNNYNRCDNYNGYNNNYGYNNYGYNDNYGYNYNYNNNFRFNNNNNYYDISSNQKDDMARIRRGMLWDEIERKYQGKRSGNNIDDKIPGPSGSGDGNRNNKISSDGYFKGTKLCGKVEIVDSSPDFDVQVVNSFPDLKVKKVTSLPDSIGEWEFVTSLADFKVRFVTSSPDFTIEFVNSFPGLP